MSEAAETSVITFLSDYGLADEFVGVCHAVIAAICPRVRVIDLTHGIPRQDVRAGALILAGSLRYLPVGVHLAVVDPGVGAERRAVALAAADGRLFVGPDNGLMWPAAQAAGGIVRAVEISRSRWRLEPVSATFHGRDLFAPVAARLACGAPLAEAGEPLEPGELVSLELPSARIDDGRLLAEVLYTDRFGNLQLAASGEHAERLGLRPGAGLELQKESGEIAPARFVRTFAEAQGDELIVYEDAVRRLAVAVNRGSAAARLNIGAGARLVLAPRT
jgi:S-adenosylmethionine hydrolase